MAIISLLLGAIIMSYFGASIETAWVWTMSWLIISSLIFRMVN